MTAQYPNKTTHLIQHSQHWQKRRWLLALLATLLLLAALGQQRAQAQGFVVFSYATLNVSGTLGDNGIYVSDVDYSWTLPDEVNPQTVVGCQSGTITEDTPAGGVLLTCYGQLEDGNGFVGVLIVDDQQLDPIIRRDTIAPGLGLISPSQPQVTVDEGSSLTLNAEAKDVNSVTVGWDLDEDGTIDAPNPTTVQIPGLQGSHNPCFIVTAVDEAGNVKQLVVEVTINNLAPSIDSWVVPNTIHFGGTVQMSAATSDPGNDPLSALVHWGDGLVEPVVVKADGTLTAAHTYASSGSFAIILQLDDGDGGFTEERHTLTVEDPVDVIEGSLIPGTLGMIQQGILNEGQAISLVVKLEGAADDLEAGEVETAVHKLNAYLQQFTAVVPNASVAPCFLVATDLRDGLLSTSPPPD